MSEQESTSEGLEGASPVREEDAFDLEAVRRWLGEQGVELGDEVDVQQFGGGASNLTYSLRDGHHDLILRRPPAGQKAKAPTTWGVSSACSRGWPRPSRSCRGWSRCAPTSP